VTTAAPATRFDGAFAARASRAVPAVIPYFTAGYPRRDVTSALLLAAQSAGCVAVEVGIPFSDPLADGPTVQQTGWTALQQGMTLPLALEQVRDARAAGLRIPVAVMTYFNPVLSLGVEEFAHRAAGHGVDGVIVPDLPADEAGELRTALHRAGLALIPLVAPTTPPERIARIVDTASGFIYCVGVTGVTGVRETIADEALELLDTVGGLTPIPRALGFGISKRAHLLQLQGHAEAAAIGSALLQAIGRASEHDPADVAAAFLRSVSEGPAPEPV